MLLTSWFNTFISVHGRAEVTAYLSQQTLDCYERHVGLDLLRERVLFKSQVNKSNSN